MTWPSATPSRWAEPARSPGRDEGASLLLVLLVLPVVTALAGGLVLLTTAETLTTVRYQRSLVVRHAVRAIAERVVADLRRQADWTSVVSGMAVSTFAGPGLTWQLDAETFVDLSESGAALQAATNADEPRGPDTPRWQLYGWGGLDRLVAPAAWPGAPVIVAARVADDGEDGDGNPSVDANGVVTVHVEAYSLGRARWGATFLLARGRRGLDDVWRLSWRDDP